MRFAVTGAHGRLGRLIVERARHRGHDVTAIGPGADRAGADHAIDREIFALDARDLRPFDVVVAAEQFAAGQVDDHERAVRHLVGLLANENTRLIVVGAAGSLYTDSAHTEILADQPGFPADERPRALAAARALEFLRGRSDVLWTEISPAADFRAEGARTGHIVAGEEFAVNPQGVSTVSYADFAVGLVAEAEAVNGDAHVRRRISLLGH